MPGILQACDQVLLDLSDKYGLTQHVSSPTRPSSGRTLGLVFSSYPGIIQACHVTCAVWWSRHFIRGWYFADVYADSLPGKSISFSRATSPVKRQVKLSLLPTIYLPIQKVTLWMKTGPISLKRSWKPPTTSFLSPPLGEHFCETYNEQTW